jgi:CBS domain containing-hemolysin-like protein
MAGDGATVEGRTHIDEINDALELEVPESEEYETIGGLLFSRMGRVPATGEHYDLDGVRFTILEADERRINRVKITKIRDAG